ncbi:hypothetical protein LY90DRAFT_670084 [Neocallimastix californiae]|jgi:hypothetical protein|uniref:Ketopantoate reductase N-terminal domain-containing protein n=1 Tax=Neocallimastix californiae TaxID=1754190 RepID=A0A1Y2D4Z2_9FUNG|nr:hypothetical protein LY90DRAFT_670084 [Neocallimastix californiae]|eukprot:ORY54310.1 hypothetical protein LY90DRAFT_670084 [Neocallimastix californiae]
MTEERPVEVLIVGAGNIGRVYGYHLFKGGAKVHFYVREHNKQNLSNNPLVMHGLSSVIRWCNKTSTIKFSDYTVTTDTDIANGNAPNLPEHLDYVIFSVPSHHLGEGNWLKTLVTFINNKYQKNVYYTSPIPDETNMERYLDMGVEKSQLIAGQTNVSSYFAPLADQKYEPRSKEILEKDNEEKNPNKVTIFIPFFSEVVGNLTEEAKEATDKYVKILNKGGLKTVNIGKDTEYGINAILLVPILAGFSMYNWNFYDVGRDLKTMSLITASLRETSSIILKKTKDQNNSMIKAISFVPSILFASFLILFHFISLYIFSLDFEAFCNAHFNVKLGEQTDYWNNILSNDAEKYGIDISNLKKLMKQYKESSKKNE